MSNTSRPNLLPSGTHKSQRASEV